MERPLLVRCQRQLLSGIVIRQVVFKPVPIICDDHARVYDLAQDHDRAVEEEVRDMSTMALEEHEAEWRELDQADRRAAERQLGEAERSHETEAETTKGETQEPSHEKTKDRDFGMEM